MISNKYYRIIGAVTAAALCALVYTPTLQALDFELGPVSIGGAIRANYIIGDYEKDGSGAAQRGGNGGNFELDTFRVNLDLSQDYWIGAGEYRWYNGYNFLHTGYVGYDDPGIGRIEVGLNRAPFGVGPYGPANSWFFDQHYYVGLSDASKLGIKYTRAFGPLSVDLAYYLRDMWQGTGASGDSSRYSYTLVTDDVGEIPGAYEDEHQFNVRAIYNIDAINTDLGVSAQYSRMNADRRASNSDAYALAVHSNSHYGPLGLMLQLTSYKFDADYRAVEDGPQPNNDLVMMGAYDFAWPVASEGIIPAAALSYTWEPDGGWVDSITFYNDYSVILKDGRINGRDFNDSALNVTGFAVAKGGWYVYVDYAYSNGNYFVGDKGDSYDFGEDGSYANASVGDFGANFNDSWNYRFNINFGYYF